MRAYIDLGAFKGTSIKAFKKSKYYTPDTTIYAFECNPFLKEIDYGADVIRIYSAAWISDGELPLYLNKKKPQKPGSSVYKNKTTGNLDTKHPAIVPCIDFSRFLKETFAPGDHVMAKFNVEGSEYDILEKCVSDGTVNILEEIWVSWHLDKCGIDVNRHRALVNSLSKTKTITIHTELEF